MKACLARGKKNADMHCILESMFQSSFRKRAFATALETGAELVSGRGPLDALATINGNFVKKHRFVNTMAD